MRSQAGVRPGHCRPDVTAPRLIRVWSSPARWAALAALIIAPASAQVPDSATRLPDLKVTVTRTASPLSTLGAAVTVIDSAAVHRERIATSLDEALAFVPGIVVQNRWNHSLDERLAIRGFGARGRRQHHPD
jgi:outer membrane cobalamin receptor